MRRLIAAALLAATLPSAATAAERRFSVTEFERIRMSGPYAVTVRTGPGPSARAEGDREAIDRVRIEVNDRTLSIRPDRTDSGWQDRAQGRVTITITVPRLIAASLNGSGSLAIDRAKAPRFDLTVAGSGSVRLATLAADRLVLGVTGSGGIEIGGQVAQARLLVQGSGDVVAGGLVTQDADVTVNGSSDVVIAATRTAKVAASGAGDVTILGKPVCTVRTIGSGSVRCGAGR